MLVPETLQISMMDCGPVALHSLLTGFDIPVEIGRLREVCQTDIDGTSIDTLEQLANELGLEAEQTIVPVDHLLLPSSQLLPAIVVVRSTAGDPKFLLVWNVVAGFAQVMDPMLGRYWTRVETLTRSLYVHQASVDADAWGAFAQSRVFSGALERRLAAVGEARAAERVEEALRSEDNRRIAALDAATRLVTALVGAGGVKRGPHAAQLVAVMADRAARTDHGPHRSIPESFWFGWPEPPAEGDEGELMAVRGAVAVRVRGRRDASAVAEGEESEDEAAQAPTLRPEMLAHLQARPPRAAQEVWGAIRNDGLLTPAMLVGAVIAATIGVALEALVFRSVLDLVRQLAGFWSRVGMVAAILALLVALLAIEAPATVLALRIGRQVEGRLRLALLAKIPRIADRYLQSRPLSDMAERSHRLWLLRRFGTILSGILMSACELFVTMLGILWLDRTAGAQAAVLVVVVIGGAFAMERWVEEADRRVDGQLVNLTRHYFDSMRGMVALRAQGGERSLRYVFDESLRKWSDASYHRLRVSTLIQGALAAVTAALTAWLVLGALRRAGDPRALLLLLYWALALPLIATSLANQILEFPVLRLALLRMLEPLGAPDEERDALAETAFANHEGHGVAIRFDDVGIQVAGRDVLANVTLDVPAGSHIAVVGSSGAGKSTLVGLLLGWNEPTTGALTVDGLPLSGARLTALRQVTAWIDPEVQLWNRTLLDNLEFGAPADGARSIRDVLDDADLIEILRRLPDGLQTELGEGGALLSGGEGQRVRVARALRRAGARLVIMDEPFRGLELDRRRSLLARARQLWHRATVFCVMHDVESAIGFDRVLVVDDGQIIEDGSPAELAARPDGVFRRLLDARAAQLEGARTQRGWRRLRLDNGVLREVAEGDAT